VRLLFVTGLVLVAATTARGDIYQYPDQAVLFVYRPQVMLSPNCSGDAGLDDAGVPSCSGRTADLVTVVVEPRFPTDADGKPGALLMVTPAKPLVSLAPHWLFRALGDATDWRVEVQTNDVVKDYAGNVCPPPPPAPTPEPRPTYPPSTGSTSTSSGPSSGGCSGGPSSGQPMPVYSPPTPKALSMPDAAPSADPPDMAIPELPSEAGPYDLTSVQGIDAISLEPWLRAQGYSAAAEDIAAAASYLPLGWHVVALRPRPGQPTRPRDAISLTFESSEMRLPVGLFARGRPNPLPLTVYIAGETRYEIGAQRAVAFAGFSLIIGGAQLLTRNDTHLPVGGGIDADPIAFRTPPIGFVRTKTVMRERVTWVDSCKPSSAAASKGCGVVLGAADPRVPGPGLLWVGAVLALVARRRREVAC
jgi:MYXO-CTERM domain-containing protein